MQNAMPIGLHPDHSTDEKFLHNRKHHRPTSTFDKSVITRGQSDFTKAAPNDPARTARASELSRVTDKLTDLRTDIGNNSLHLMHWIQSKNSILFRAVCQRCYGTYRSAIARDRHSEG